MDTLVALGTAVAYFYSIFAMATGRPVYFESAAFITVFVLLGVATRLRQTKNVFDMTSFNDHLPMKHVHPTSIIEFTLIGFISWWFFGKHEQKEVSATMKDKNLQKVKVVVDGGYTPNTVVLKIYFANVSSNALNR